MRFKAQLLPLIVLIAACVLGTGFFVTREVLSHSQNESIAWSQQAGDGTVFPACLSSPPSGTCSSDGTAQETISWSDDVWGQTCRSSHLYLNGSDVGDFPFCSGSYTLTGLQPNQSYSCTVYGDTTGLSQQDDCSFTTPNCAAPSSSSLPSVSLTANGQSSLTITSGQNYTVAWNSSNASRCTLTDNRTDGYPNDAPQNIAPNQAGSGQSGLVGSYTFTCQGSGGSASASVTITQQQQQQQQAKCPNGSAAPNGDASQCTCSQGNQSACQSQGQSPSCNFTATANGYTGTDITVSPGDYISYAFGNANCASANFQYSVDGGPENQWIAGTCSTQSSGGTTSQSQAGHTYSLQYAVSNAGGQQAVCQAIVRVRSKPVCPDGVTPAPNGQVSQCTCAEGNQNACNNSGNPPGGNGGGGGGGSSSGSSGNYGCTITVSPARVSPGGIVNISWNNICSPEFGCNYLGLSVSPANATLNSKPVPLNGSTTDTPLFGSAPEAVYTLSGPYYIGFGILQVPIDSFKCQISVAEQTATCPDGSPAPGGDPSKCTYSCTGNGSEPPPSPDADSDTGQHATYVCETGCQLDKQYCADNNTAIQYDGHYDMFDGWQSHHDCVKSHTEDDGYVCTHTNADTGKCDAGYEDIETVCDQYHDYDTPITHAVQCPHTTYCPYSSSGYGCQAGSSGPLCAVPPEVKAPKFQVSPVLIKSGGMVSVSWTPTPGSQPLVCTTSGSNGDVWKDDTNGATHQSSPIKAQTIYTLECIGSITGDQLAPQAETVNLVPSFQEK